MPELGPIDGAMLLMVMRARKSSTCPACEEPIEPGQYIARQVSPWMHWHCLPIVQLMQDGDS